MCTLLVVLDPIPTGSQKPRDHQKQSSIVNKKYPILPYSKTKMDRIPAKLVCTASDGGLVTFP